MGAPHAEIATFAEHVTMRDDGLVTLAPFSTLTVVGGSAEAGARKTLTLVASFSGLDPDERRQLRVVGWFEGEDSEVLDVPIDPIVSDSGRMFFDVLVDTDLYPGRYTFDVVLGDTKIASVPLLVNFR